MRSYCIRSPRDGCGPAHSAWSCWVRRTPNWPKRSGLIRRQPAQLRLADRLLTEHSDVPRQVVDELAARAERLFERLPDEVLGAIPTASRTCPGNYFFPVEIPAETLRRECGVLAVPVSVFGESRWSGSILTSLADAFGPPPTAAR